MVKIDIDDAKGLVHSAGSGTTVANNFAVQSGLDVRAGKAGTNVVSRSIVGRDVGGADPFSESSTKLFPLGTKLQYGERVFRYAKASGATIGIGETVQAAIPVANNNDRAVAQIGSANPAVGDTSIKVTLGGAATLNQFEDGYVVIVDGTGQGQLLHIASNDAAAGCTLELLEPVQLAMNSSNSKASVFVNQYAEVLKTPAAPSAAVLGVAPIDVTADYYFWVQTSGPAAVVQAAANEPAAGKIAVASENTAGAAEILDIGDIAESLALGHCISSTVEAADHCVIMLNLE